MNSETLRILIVDDNLADAQIVRRYLRKIPEREFEIVHSPDSQTGLDVLANGNVDCVLLDYHGVSPA